MSFEWGGGNFQKLPKVGEEPKVFKVEKIERIEDETYKFNFKKKETVTLENGNKAETEVNAGFRVEITLKDEEKLTLNSWGPYYAFGKANIQNGDTVKVSHPEKGKWEVEKIEDKQEKPTTSEEVTEWDG